MFGPIFFKLKQTPRTNLERNPLTVLSGLPPTEKQPITAQRVVAFATLFARCTSILKWERVSPPTHISWTRENLKMSTEVEVLTKGIFDSIP